MMAELRTMEVKNAVTKTIQSRLEEINRESAEIVKNLGYTVVILYREGKDAFGI